MRRALILAAFLLAAAVSFSADAQNLCDSGYCTKTRATCSLVGVTCWTDDITYCNHCSCASTSIRTNCCLTVSTCCPAASDLNEGDTKACKLSIGGGATPAPPVEVAKPEAKTETQQ
jgi:hypothetical protein